GAVVGERLVHGGIGEGHGRAVGGLARGRELREVDALQARLLPLEAAATAHLVVQVVGRDRPGVVYVAPDRARVEVAQGRRGIARRDRLRGSALRGRGRGLRRRLVPLGRGRALLARGL